MRSPDTSGNPAPNVPLILAAALGLWAMIYLSAVGFWLRRAGPAVPVESNATQLARVQVPPHARPRKRVKLAKLARKRRSGPSLTARTFAANTMH
jgi:hypothetical protein